MLEAGREGPATKMLGEDLEAFAILAEEDHNDVEAASSCHMRRIGRTFA